MSTSSSPRRRWRTWPATASAARSRSTQAVDRTLRGPAARGCSSWSPQQAAANPEWTAPPGADFPTTGGNYWHQRYSALDQINASNVAELGAAWLVGLGGRPARGQLEGTPVVLDGVMYVSTGTRGVLALDAATGAVKWRYRPDAEGAVRRQQGRGGGRGQGVPRPARRRAGGARPADGEVVWETQLTAEPGAYVSAPAVYHDGLVYIGTSGGDSGARGQMGAYDAQTGREVWRFYTIPGADDRLRGYVGGRFVQERRRRRLGQPDPRPRAGNDLHVRGQRRPAAVRARPTGTRDFRDEGQRGLRQPVHRVGPGAGP